MTDRDAAVAALAPAFSLAHYDLLAPILSDGAYVGMAHHLLDTITPENARSIARALPGTLEHAWAAVEAVKAEGWAGPTIDRGDGTWIASAFPSIDFDGYEPEPTDGYGDTPTAALYALAEKLASR